MIDKILPFIFAGAGIGLFFMFTDPLYSIEIDGLKKEIATIQDAKSAAEQFKTEQQNILQKRSSVTANDQARIEKLLPDNVESVNVFLDLDTLATQYGVKVVDVSVEDKEKKDEEVATPTVIGSVVNLAKSGDPSGSMPIKLSVLGSYTNVQNFLRALENSLRAIDITEVSFPASETGIYKMELTLQVYWLK